MQLAMIVAVSAMRMVQVTIHQIVDVIPVGHCLVAAVRIVSVRFIVPGTAMARSTFLRIH